MSKVRLGDVAIEVRETSKCPEGLPVVGLEHLLPSEITLTQWSDTSDNTFNKLFHKGQILFGRRRAYLKKAAVAPFDGVCSGDITVIAAKPERLLTELLPFIISNDAFFDYAMEKSAGSLSPRVKWAQLAEYEFDLPELEEQQKLANLLWAMERTRKAYQDLLIQADELVKSQFVEEIQSLIDADATVLLDDLIDDDRPITYGILKPGTGFAGGIPVVKVKDMRDGIIDESDLLLTSPDIDQAYQRSKLRAGDLLISIRGSIGRMAEVPDSLQDANITQDTARLSVKPAYNRVYLRGVLESAPMQRDMEKNIRGVAVKGINIGYLRNLPIPMPGRDRQDALAQLYIQTDKSKLAIRQALESLEKSRSAIMTKVFG